jgi:hypothetical protein
MNGTAIAMLSLALDGLAHATAQDTPASPDREYAPFNVAVDSPKGTSLRLYPTEYPRRAVPQFYICTSP